MSRSKIFLFLPMTLAALLVAAGSEAQEHRWEVSPEGGYLFGGKLISDFDAVNGRKITGALENAGVYGLRAAFVARTNILLDIEAARTDARFVLQDGPTQEVSSFRTDFLIGSAGFRFEVAGSHPYLSIGAGAARFDPSTGRRETRFTAALGTGVEKFLYPSLGFRLDGRLFASRLNGATLGLPCSVPESPDGSAVRPCSGRSWLWNSDVTAGLVFAF